MPDGEGGQLDPLFDRGLVARHAAAGRSIVRITPAGLALLSRRRPQLAATTAVRRAS